MSAGYTVFYFTKYGSGRNWCSVHNKVFWISVTIILIYVLYYCMHTFFFTAKFIYDTVINQFSASMLMCYSYPIPKSQQSCNWVVHWCCLNSKGLNVVSCSFLLQSACKVSDRDESARGHLMISFKPTCLKTS